MRLLFILGALVLPASVFGAASTSGVDPATMLVSYGVAAPFAALCLWQMKARDAELVKVRDENKQLREAAVGQARDSTMQMVTLLNDAGRLFRAGNEVLSKPPAAEHHDELHDLTASVQELVHRLSEDHP